MSAPPRFDHGTVKSIRDFASEFYEKDGRGLVILPEKANGTQFIYHLPLELIEHNAVRLGFDISEIVEAVESYDPPAQIVLWFHPGAEDSWFFVGSPDALTLEYVEAA